MATARVMQIQVGPMELGPWKNKEIRGTDTEPSDWTVPKSTGDYRDRSDEQYVRWRVIDVFLPPDHADETPHNVLGQLKLDAVRAAPLSSFLREAWKGNDGSEGDSVRRACEMIERLPRVANEFQQALDAAEQLQVQLAGCGAAALGSTDDVATAGMYGWSPSYQEVLDLRRKYDGLQRDNLLETKADGQELAEELAAAQAALVHIERIVSDDLSFDLTARVHVSDPPRLEMTTEEVRLVEQKISAVYRASHAFVKKHSCHSVHNHWRDEVLRAQLYRSRVLKMVGQIVERGDPGSGSAIVHLTYDEATEVLEFAGATAFWRAANKRWTDWAQQTLGYVADDNGIIPGDDGQRKRLDAILNPQDRISSSLIESLWKDVDAAGPGFRNGTTAKLTLAELELLLSEIRVLSKRPTRPAWRDGLPDVAAWWMRRRGNDEKWFEVSMTSATGAEPLRPTVYNDDMQKMVSASDITSPLDRWFGPVVDPGTIASPSDT